MRFIEFFSVILLSAKMRPEIAKMQSNDHVIQKVSQVKKRMERKNKYCKRGLRKKRRQLGFATEPNGVLEETMNKKMQMNFLYK